jgi:TatD DNase family protein
MDAPRPLPFTVPSEPLAQALVDSHCHLDFPEFHGREGEILDLMAQAGVTSALVVGVTLERFPAVLALAEGHPNLHASVGVHPDTDTDAREPGVEELVTLANHPKVVAIGETGLDYYRLSGDLEWQRDRFRAHIRAARTVNKPLIIHTRAASADTLRVLAEEGGGEAGGVFHCFTETREVALQAIAMGFHISFSGIISFKNAADLRAVVPLVPDDRLLVETDAPYLAPVPHRGKLNHPALVRHVAEEVARLRGVSVEQIAELTTRNFNSLFLKRDA